MINQNEATKPKEEDELMFAYAEIVRLIRNELDSDKIVRERVKIEMNKFLGNILKDVCKQLNAYPYTTVDYEMFKECIYPYTNIRRIDQERERIITHLESIKGDCDILISDVEKTLKTNENDEIGEK